MFPLVALRLSQFEDVRVCVQVPTIRHEQLSENFPQSNQEKDGRGALRRTDKTGPTCLHLVRGSRRREGVALLPRPSAPSSALEGRRRLRHVRSSASAVDDGGRVGGARLLPFIVCEMA